MKIILVLALVCFEIIKSCTYNQNIPDNVLPPNGYFEVDKTDENRNETIDVDSNTNFEDKKNADANDEIISIDLLMWNGVSLNGLKMTT